MINDYPNLQNQEPDNQKPVSQKLVLPGQTEEYSQPDGHTQSIFVHPDQLRHRISPTSNNPFSRLKTLWHAEPVYKVLMVASVMVLVAGIIFATFLINTFAQSAPSAPKVAASLGTMATTTSKASATTPPAFPTPSGGQGSKQSSSQPPQSAPMVLPTFTPSNSNQQPQDQGQNQNQNLQLQITAFPQQVTNNSDAQITVTTNQPGITVQLSVTFDNSIITNTAGPQDTANDGTATLDWHVANVSLKQTFVARITAYATDQNGQQVTSQTISVNVSNQPGF